MTDIAQKLVEKKFVAYLPIIVCCCCMCGIPSAMLVSTSSIFYVEVSADLGVQTAEISAWMSLMLLSCALFSPFLGGLVAKYDIRWLMVGSVILEALVFCAFAVAPAPWLFWVAGFISGISNTILLGLASATLINRWFKRHVGLLLGICTAFTGIGGVVFLQVGQAIINACGWRVAYFAFAAIAVVVCIPLILLCVRAYPAERGLLPYGTAWALEHAEDKAHVEEPPSVNPSVGTRSSVFWIIIAFGFLVNFVCQINGYFPKYVNWVNEQALTGVIGAAFITGATLASVAQAGNALGKIFLGLFSDLSVGKAISILSGCGALGIVLVWQFPSTILMPIGGLIFGLFIAGVLVLLPMLVRRVFGEGKNYSVFYGRISVAPTLGGAAANIIWPILADNAGGFDVVFAVAVVMIFLLFLLGQVAYRMRDKLPREV